MAGLSRHKHAHVLVSVLLYMQITEGPANELETTFSEAFSEASPHSENVGLKYLLTDLWHILQSPSSSASGSFYELWTTAKLDVTIATVTLIFYNVLTDFTINTANPRLNRLEKRSCCFNHDAVDWR